MKIVYMKKTRLLAVTVICLSVLLVIVLNAIGYFLNCKYISVFAAMSQTNDYEVRSELLMQAMDSVGACNPQDAAQVWASGLKMRSAALQYAALDKALKAKYAAQLDKSTPNWVTGVSSPWVESYKIVSTETPGKDCSIIHLKFSTETSTGPYKEYAAALTICREDNFWRITSISADEGLYPYTHFVP